MARTTQTRKRSRPFGPSRRFKRRRFARRRRRTSRFKGLTNRNSGPVSIGRFRARRIPKRVYRNWLWMSTSQKSHYRSVGSSPSVVTTPATLVDATLFTVTPGGNVAGNVFWIPAGGAQSEDTGVAVPSFIGDIILRGGVSRVSISNRIDPIVTQPTDCVRVTVFTVWTNKDIPGFAFPATVPIGWDPSVFPDFQRHGRVIGRREAILKPDGEALELYYRHRIAKIDQNEFVAGGNRLQYFILVSQMGNSDAAQPEVVDVVTTINYSFSADAQ